ncbi:hypothetical protein CPJ18_23105 [Agrobacterium rosae]|uniref:Uncharacterized protein n=1 Tax=Agrobacterium rosae TaxID=1972867 RepID=A0AAE5VMD5_9HYPH|nr:hypothetical protein DXM21_22555 [Agrobacterium rosae]KAA3513899.1 hypothetical protein DXM25_22745 [Agrobacterium rosae]MQB50918.1 hypothetical protein [Agrobacterium rosae]POO48867.1 hypothetical protein CPJ18_23105 [Agrobacterium rosae]
MVQSNGLLALDKIRPRDPDVSINPAYRYQYFKDPNGEIPQCLKFRLKRCELITDDVEAFRLSID